ncbi:hypothetical protein ACIA6C_32695 [Streptomyces sp. NPDC051578]
MNVTLVERAPAVVLRDASKGGCGATCTSSSCPPGVA